MKDQPKERLCKRHGNPANGMGMCPECYAENGEKRRANAAEGGRPKGPKAFKHRLVLTGGAARDVEAYARSAAVVKKVSEAYQTLVLLIGESVIEQISESLDD